MPSALRHRAKRYASIKAARGIFWLAFSAALILLGWRILGFHTDVSHTFLQISLKASVDGTAQLYYDLGSGLSETDSATLSVIGDQVYHDYQFRLPDLPVYGMRFDPLMSEGSVAVRHIRWMDGLGAVMRNVPLKQLKPLHHIGTFAATDQEVEVVTDQRANDPQIGIPLTRPLTAGRGDSFLRHPTVLLGILIECVAAFIVIMVLSSFWLVWRGRIALMIREGKIPLAMLLAFFTVILIEIMQRVELPEIASYHEVDTLLYQLERQRIHADYMLLGDSVGRQLFQHTPDLQNEKYAMLATNQAVTMTGQYFIAKRYLQQNKRPRAVILLTSSHFGDLDRELTDNYIQRTFTHFSEIIEIFTLKKDPVFTAKMLAYRWLPSFKYRLSLQKRWAGYTNAETFTGIPYDNGDSGAARYSLLRILKPYVEKENIPRHHFESLLAILDISRIPMFYLIPAINERNMASFRESNDLLGRIFPELKKTRPLFHFDDDARLLRAEYFGDGTHFNEAGLKIETGRLHEKIMTIEKRMN